MPIRYTALGLALLALAISLLSLALVVALILFE